MKIKFMLLCSLFMLLCVLPMQARADNGASIAQKAYDRLVAEQAVEREQQAIEVKKQSEAHKKLVNDIAARQEAEQKAKAIEEEKQAGINRVEQEEREKLEAQQAAEDKAAEKTLRRECSKDYGQLRVGMKLDRVQKCVAEFSLKGQIKTKDGVVDHYTRGDSWLYVKKGKVVAWGG